MGPAGYRIMSRIPTGKFRSKFQSMPSQYFPSFETSRHSRHAQALSSIQREGSDIRSETSRIKAMIRFLERRSKQAPTWNLSAPRVTFTGRSSSKRSSRKRSGMNRTRQLGKTLSSARQAHPILKRTNRIVDRKYAALFSKKTRKRVRFAPMAECFYRKF